MSSISIELNENEGTYILSGATEKLISNKRAKIYLKDYLAAYISDESKIIVSYEQTEKEDKLVKIQKMLKKFNITEERSVNVEESLSEFFQEERSFDLFSQKAKGIRNQDVNQQEFNEFVECLKVNLPNRRLYELQLLSAFHLAFSQNACNFSVPGAGKTSIVYGAYSYLKALQDSNQKKVDKLLIIGPLSSFGPWENEYEECFGSKPPSIRLSGGISKTARIHHLFSTSPAELTLLSYQGVVSLKDDLIQFLKMNKVMVVLDEAHKIKNTDGGVIAQSVLELAKYSKSRVILTGTPAPNGYEDLMNLFKFIWPTKKIINFKKYHLEEMSENSNDERITELVNSIEPYYIRIKKQDLGIPNPINNPPIIVRMNNVQEKVYKFIESKYMDYLIDSDQAGNDLKSYLVKARLIRMMQAATNPRLLTTPLINYLEDSQLANENFIDDSEIISLIFNYHNIEVPNKFIVAKNLILEKIGKNEKVIVWMTFIENMLQFSEYLKACGIENKLLYGAVPVESDSNDSTEFETRESIIREFHNNNSSFQVIIANPFATSESISLHKVCHNAIYIERTFNAAQFIQSKDRIHRYGLKKTDTINYYYLVSENTIDEVIHERLALKEQRMTELIENSDIPLFRFLEEEFEDDDIKVMINKYVQRTN
ncbi:DEAD/DEAH box helicase [Neobacillus sp. NPDC093182]|uniref:DEAD/DEAH box helicase n=1 Tax=Neobacillus sp. NPDC093182 TaxID=3364297 RepID=UPI0037F5B16D